MADGDALATGEGGVHVVDRLGHPARAADVLAFDPCGGLALLLLPRLVHHHPHRKVCQAKERLGAGETWTDLDLAFASRYRNGEPRPNPYYLAKIKTAVGGRLLLPSSYSSCRSSSASDRTRWRAWLYSQPRHCRSFSAYHRGWLR